MAVKRERASEKPKVKGTPSPQAKAAPGLSSKMGAQQSKDDKVEGERKRPFKEGAATPAHKKAKTDRKEGGAVEELVVAVAKKSKSKKRSKSTIDDKSGVFLCSWCGVVYLTGERLNAHKLHCKL